MVLNPTRGGQFYFTFGCHCFAVLLYICVPLPLICQCTCTFLPPECDESLLFQGYCNGSKNIVVEKGDNIAWNCQISAPPNSNLRVMLNNKVVQPYLGHAEKDSLMELCDKDSQVLYYVEENPDHVCYNKFTVHIVVCAAGESVVGDYYIVGDQEKIMESTKNIALTPPSGSSQGGIFLQAHIHVCKYTLCSLIANMGAF